MTKKVIVVGSGFGGLASALRLKAKGYDVTLLEKHPDLGGRARVFKKNGFIFDAGPTVITAPYLINELFELFNKKSENYINLKPLKTWYRFIFDDGSKFDYSGDEDLMKRQIEKVNKGPSHEAMFKACAMCAVKICSECRDDHCDGCCHVCVWGLVHERAMPVPSGSSPQSSPDVSPNAQSRESPGHSGGASSATSIGAATGVARGKRHCVHCGQQGHSANRCGVAVANSQGRRREMMRLLALQARIQPLSRADEEWVEQKLQREPPVAMLDHNGKEVRRMPNLYRAARSPARTQIINTPEDLAQALEVRRHRALTTGEAAQLGLSPAQMDRSPFAQPVYNTPGASSSEKPVLQFPDEDEVIKAKHQAVSYTHLTLPTKRIV